MAFNNQSLKTNYKSEKLTKLIDNQNYTVNILYRRAYYGKI